MHEHCLNGDLAHAAVIEIRHPIIVGAPEAGETDLRMVVLGIIFTDVVSGLFSVTEKSRLNGILSPATGIGKEALIVGVTCQL